MRRDMEAPNHYHLFLLKGFTMAGTTIKLQTNIPVMGTVEYCDFIPTKNPTYSDQIALRGKWDGAGDGRIYLHLSLEQDLQRLGVIGQRLSNGNYPLLVQAPKVKLCKVEQGGTKKTIVELLSHAGALAQQVQAYTQPQTNLYQPQTTTVAPPPAPDITVADLVTTMKDSIALATEIMKQANGTEEFSVAQVGTTLFEQRCRLALYGKTETVPF